jgi:hypothetical protein
LHRIVLGAAERREPSGQQRLVVDHEGFDPICVPLNADGSMPVAGLEVVLPQIRRFHHVGIHVHNQWRDLSHTPLSFV